MLASDKTTIQNARFLGATQASNTSFSLTRRLSHQTCLMLAFLCFTFDLSARPYDTTLNVFIKSEVLYDRPIRAG